LAGSGIYSYKSADHFYKGYLTKFNTLSGDTINSVYTGGMITNLKLSPDKQYIVFSTLYRSSEYYSPNVYKETEKTELILTDINFNEFKILRNDFRQDYQYVDAEIFNAVNFSHDSKKIVTVTDEHHIFAFDVESGQMTDSLYSCDCYGDMDVGFVYNNNNIVTGTNNGKVFIWNLVWDVNIDDIKLENSPYITSIACSEKHNLYVVGDYKGKLYLLTSREFSDIYNEDDDFIKIQQFDKVFKIINNTFSPVQVEIYNLLGEKIIERSFSQQENFLNIEQENLSSGLYFMRIQSGTFSKIVKIII
jgi:WD40 repeat protein